MFIQQKVLERKFQWNWFTNTRQFSLIFKPRQIIFIHYNNSRLVVDENDNGKFRLERVKPLKNLSFHPHQVGVGENYSLCRTWDQTYANLHVKTAASLYYIPMYI